MKLNTESNILGRWALTSTIDWCEPNYTSSNVVAEAWNTFSNLCYIILSAYFLYKTELFYGAVSKKNRLWRSIVEGFGATMVGIGSFLFHMTL
jgi:dihydroceramidase